MMTRYCQERRSDGATRRRRGIQRSSFILHSSAFSLAEVAVSVVLVGGLLVAALTTLGGAAAGRKSMADRGMGALLAQDLMAEILRQSYKEPVDTATFGRETGEAGDLRATYDDVDDYHGWIESPPEHKDGAEFGNLTGWYREVQVYRLDASDLTKTATVETGVKQITVTVKHNDVVVASVVAVRTGPVELGVSRFPMERLLKDALQIE